MSQVTTSLFRPATAANVRTASPRAFTLIELIVTISIIVMLTSILLPSLHHARDRARRAVIQVRLQDLASIMRTYWLDEDVFPSTDELGESGLLDESGLGFVWDGVEIRDPDFDYCFVVESADAWGFLLCAYPKPPYEYGSFVYCINETGEIIEGPPNEEAAADEAQKMQLARRRMLIGAGRIISVANNPDDAAYLLPYLQTIDPQDVLSRTFDQNHDGVISQAERNAFIQPQPGDTPIVSEIRNAFGDAYAILRLDGDYDLSVDELQGDPTALFHAVHINDLIDASLAKPGVANAMKAKVIAAQNARLRGNQKACAKIVASLRNQLSAQAGKAILVDDAALLDSLAIVLAPIEFSPDGEE